MIILHVTPHMGGGVGHALSDLIIHDKVNQHRIVMLQTPQKRRYMEKCIANGIEVYEEPTMYCIAGYMNSADIIIIHWWHHPVVCKFLYNFPHISNRLILWSHISGCSYPLLTYEFADKFDKIFLTSQYTLDNPYWRERERERIIAKSAIIYGQGQMAEMRRKRDYTQKEGIVRIGYVGTLAKSKLHPDFPVICKKILELLPSAEFYLVGDKESGTWIENQAKTLGIEQKIHLIGFVDNVNEWLMSFDIFGYPLNPYHFGTTENSILEAMSVGVPIILFNQATEKYILTDNEDGILADGIEDYVVSVVRLANNERLRRQLGENAAINLCRKFSFEKNLQKFQNEVEKMGKQKPTEKSFHDVLGPSPYNWFCSAMNEKDRRVLTMRKYDEMEPIFLEESKSSILHFARSFPEDEKLQGYRKELEKGGTT